nr:MAG TPA: Major tail protein [Caudoviricetes sp.]
MSIRLSTAGITLKYAVEATKGAKPTTGYTEVPEIKEIPEINPEPSTLETTTLKETEYKTYIDGLKDLGGALTFVANLTEDFKTTWEDIMSSYETAKAAGKAVWWLIDIPGITEGCYFTGNPSNLGVPGAGVDSVLEVNVYITPTNAPTWAAKPTA